MRIIIQARRRARRLQRDSAAAAAQLAFRARVAADPGVTIADFAFAPDTTTVHVGDTITWINNGPSSHTATARDGSFDSGVLARGQSASHTFTRAGTVAYYCKIHPFMHATIVVLASSNPATAASGSHPTTRAAGSSLARPGVASSSTSPSGGGTLPLTGLDLKSVVFIGLGLAGVGLAIRRSLRHS